MDYPAEILKLLERNTAAGAYLSQVFTDWLDLTHATLAALPAHAASASRRSDAAGTLAEDTPETQALFARCRSRYPGRILATLPASLSPAARQRRRLLGSRQWGRGLGYLRRGLHAYRLQEAQRAILHALEHCATHGANDHPRRRTRDHRPAAPGSACRQFSAATPTPTYSPQRSWPASPCPRTKHTPTS